MEMVALKNYQLDINSFYAVGQSVGAVKYTHCISAEG